MSLFFNSLPIKKNVGYSVLPFDGQLGFQEPCSTSMEAIIAFHDDIMFYVIFITMFVLYMLVRTLILFRNDVSNPNWANMEKFKVYYSRLSHHVGLEIV